MLDHQSILNALQPVQDPELKKSLVTLNMIRNVSIKDSTVEFTLVLTTPACPLKELIIQDCEKALKELPEVQEVKINVTSETPVQKALPTQQSIPNVKNIIAVSSGKGGVGKSTVAVNTAVALAQMGAKVGLLDADIYGPNAPTMLGVEDYQVTVEKRPEGDILEPVLSNGIKMVSMGMKIKF